MHNVLFKTSEPHAPETLVEFYVISLWFDVDEKTSFVDQRHGWWDNKARTALFDSDSGSLPETFTSFGEALDRFYALRLYRASDGFMHSFTWEGFVGEPSNYKLINPPPERPLI